ncbi:MAG: OmpH family outer membrane protein [Bacteroidota bacterium]
MSPRILFVAVLMALVSLGNLSAQGIKIGYANIDAILALMPETATMQQELQTYEQKLVEDLQSRQQYLQTLYAEYQEMVAPFQNGAVQPTAEQTTEIEAKQQEVIKLEETLQKKQQESQGKLMERRQIKMQPIIERIQKEIDALAEEESYDYVFNAVDGSGVSIILHAPESDNLTIKLLNRLGIEVPEELQAEGTEAGGDQ